MDDIEDELQDVQGDESEEIGKTVKKMRSFSAKEFQKNLTSSSLDCTNALKEFLALCKETKKRQDYVLEYFQSGGSCMQLLQLLERDNTIHPNLILEIVYHVVLRVSANYPQYRSSTNEGCQHLLNNYMTLINKTLGLSSTGKDRKIILKLLTALVTFSANLAKDILVHVNFNPGILDIFIKHTTDGKDSVRNAFVHFLMAFLVDGHFPTIHALLEKRGLLSSIINGLLYDEVDIVCLVLTTMKSHILEHVSIKKTLKMKLFSTFVIRDIVNLYNWKGPKGVKRKNAENAIVHVDEVEKSKVNESVHNFLLVLCTSYKYGVIFSDRLIGLGKQHQNTLMLTVLNGIERPWDHSYANELVIKICVACPDLTRVVWSSLRTYLEPRATKHWLNAVKFSHNLLTALRPTCIEYCIRDLSPHQLAQVMQLLAAPTIILKVLLPEIEDILTPVLKYNVLTLIHQMLRSISMYLKFARKMLSEEKTIVVNGLVRDHIQRNFPKPQSMFDKWKETERDVPPEFDVHDSLDNLTLILDISNLYDTLCPQMLNNILNTIDTVSLTTLSDFETVDDDDRKVGIMIKATNLFLNLDTNIFLPNRELFSYVLPIIYEAYYRTKNVTSLNTLIKLYKLTGIFDGNDTEISVWINSICSLKKFDRNVIDFILKSTRDVSLRILDYNVELNEIKSTIVAAAADDDNNDSCLDFDHLLDSLKGDVRVNAIKRQLNMSPLILGYLHNVNSNKYVKCYLNTALVNLLHVQFNPSVIISVVKKYEEAIGGNVFSYITSWSTGDEQEPRALDNFKSRMNVIEKLSKVILLNGEEEEDDVVTDEDVNCYANCRTDLIHMCVFYLTNLADMQKLEQRHLDSLLKYTKMLIRGVDEESVDRYLEIIFDNANLLRHFDVSRKGGKINKTSCTRYVTEIVKEFKCKDARLVNVREKLYESVKRILIKPKKIKFEKNDFLIDILNAIGLNYDHCRDVLNSLSSLDEELYVNVSHVALYALKRYHSLCKDDQKLILLDKEIIDFLSKCLAHLNAKETNTTAFANALRLYLQEYPHSLRHVNDALFNSILNKKEYCKESSLLARLLLISTKKYLESLSKNLQNICNTKGLILPLLDAAIEQKADETLLNEIYANFECSLTKSLEKPQKAVAHFDVYYKSLTVLINDFYPIEKCLKYVQKVQRYETTELYHVNLLCTIFDKVLTVRMDERHLNNCIVTLIHLGISLLKKKGKGEDDWHKIKLITNVIDAFLKRQIVKSIDGYSFEQVNENETFQLYNKFCLKFGLSGREYLLQLLVTFTSFLRISDDYGTLMMDMIITHSDFLDVVLSDNRTGKVEVLNLMLALCERCPKIMQKNHLPIYLASYNATHSVSDKIVLALLKLYESAAGQTYFYDFKPFLWGKAAANYYSVRSDINKSLWRQPKMSNTVDLLQERTIRNTTKSYPLNGNWLKSMVNVKDRSYVYDFNFILPLFSYLLSPENSVQTYRFCRSGALSLTISAMSSDEDDVRAAACYVLYRFYNHLDAKQGGTDKLIYLRLIDALCKGTAVLNDCKMNNFASLFFAKMALILTEPLHVMYVPLSQYLSAKSTPNINTIPELFTLLHSPDVNYIEHRHFILEIIRDGLRTDNDLKIALKSMAFKFVLELYNCSVCDVDSKIIILEILKNACLTSKGVKYLCNVHGLMSFLHVTVVQLINTRENRMVTKILDVLYFIIKCKNNVHFDCFTFSAIVAQLIDNNSCDLIKDARKLHETIYLLYCKYEAFLTKDRFAKILCLTECKEAAYLFNYGNEIVNNKLLIEDSNVDDDEFYYVKLLTMKYVQNVVR